MGDFFGAGSIGSFREAGRSYLERIALSAPAGREEGLTSRARAILQKVQNDLRSAERASLIYRFATFSSVIASAGGDILYFILEPPVLKRQVAAQLARNVPPSWLEDGDKVCRPGNSEVFAYVGDIPRLACFGYLLFELFAVELAPELKADATLDEAAFAGKLAKFISREVSQHLASEGYSDHTHRKFIRMARILEKVSEGGFDLKSLQDEHVLAAWRRLAKEEGSATRFVELLRMLSDLSASVNETAMVQPLEMAADMHDMTVSYAIDDNSDLSHASLVEDRAAQFALSDPILSSLLGKEGVWVANFLLIELAHLRGVYLSRMRALGFRSMENRIIQAKRDKVSLDFAMVPEDDPSLSYAGQHDQVGGWATSLLDLIEAQISLLWGAGEYQAAIEMMIMQGLVSEAEAEALQEEGVDAVGLHPSLATFADKLEKGKRHWARLKRRNAMKPPAGALPSDFLEDAVYLAGDLRRAVVREHERLGGALSNCSSPEQIQSEVSHFHQALLDVHQLTAK